MVETLLMVAGLVCGAGIGAFVRRSRSQRVLSAAEAKAEYVRQEAARSAQLTRRESDARIRDEALRVEREGMSAQEYLRQECRLISERVRRLEARCERRESGLRTLSQQIETRNLQLREAESKARATKRQAKECRAGYAGMLQQRAAQTTGEIKAQLVTSAVEETRSRCADRLRNLDTSENSTADRRAKRIMGIAVQRYTGYCPRERGASAIVLEKGEAERLKKNNSDHLALLVETSGAQLVFSDNDDMIRIDTGNGMARELCRRAVRRFLREKKIRDPQKLIGAIHRELEQEAVACGRDAFKTLRLDSAAPAVSDLLGKLNWRLSYTQNQYRHSIEAAELARLMAAELGLDLRTATRATLLHDIGKSLTHNTEGSHALLGAEIARNNGEPEEVANAIGAHHGEEPMNSAYAWIATAADAMSGGRPGARREITEQYDERIDDLEQVAADFKGVQSVHAVQGGRELRVHVDEQHFGDDDLRDLSGLIARKISDELTFPGQIRVTVIREFRAVATAS